MLLNPLKTVTKIFAKEVDGHSDREYCGGRKQRHPNRLKQVAAALRTHGRKRGGRLCRDGQLAWQTGFETSWNRRFPVLRQILECGMSDAPTARRTRTDRQAGTTTILERQCSA